MVFTSVLAGAVAALSLVAALFFLRFWSRTGDRFFQLFALGLVGVAICMSPVLIGKYFAHAWGAIAALALAIAGGVACFRVPMSPSLMRISLLAVALMLFIGCDEAVSHFSR